MNSDALPDVDVLDSLSPDEGFITIAECIAYAEHAPARVWSPAERQWGDVVTRRCALGCPSCAHLPTSNPQPNQSDTSRSVTESVTGSHDRACADFSGRWTL